MSVRAFWKSFYSWLAMVLLSAFLLQLAFAFFILSLKWWDGPPSTAFQRSAIWQAVRSGAQLQWQHQPISQNHMANSIKRAVVASEDSVFFTHKGVDWNAIQIARKHNSNNSRVRGGSTITQQLAKNLYLSGEGSLTRKTQELLFAWMLELALSKQRILGIYLNQVEWGDGIYGIEAASRHYFRQSADKLSNEQAARLAVMLPQPKKLGAAPYSAYMQKRTQTIQQRIHAVQLPASQP